MGHRIVRIAVRAVMVLPASTSSSPAGRVESAIRSAASATGADFTYLLNTAMRESSLNPSAKASTSSATGLYQFIDSTWLQMVKEAGPSLGLQDYADAITRTPGGGYQATSPQARQAILALRTDPGINAMMAGALTQKNAESLASSLGRTPSSGELYIAHFLGAGGASSLIRMAATDGDAPAAQTFPQQAEANPTIFYDQSGRARSASDVYAALTSRYDSSAPAPVAASAQAASPDEADLPNAGAWMGIPSVNAYAGASGKAGGADMPFAGLFRTSASAPVSNYVAATWSTLGTRPVSATATPAPVQVRPGKAADAVQAPLAPVRAAAGKADPAPSSLGSFLSNFFAVSQAAPLHIAKGSGA